MFQCQKGKWKLNPKNYECVEKKPRGGVKLDLKLKLCRMNVVFCFCIFSGSSLLFRAENWVEIRSKIAPSEVCRLCRSHMSCGRVIHADASFAFLPATRSRRPRLRVTCAFLFRAVAWAMRPRHCDFLPFAWSRKPCGRVTSRWSSPQFLVFLPFLQASFPISHSFMPYKAWNT